jgi:PTH1 family peptidyl-tRNA hydrolase
VHAVIGLGNPGAEYSGTRHNVGFLVADHLAGRCNARFRKVSDDLLLAETRSRNKDLLIVKPVTFMNRSGLAARAIVDGYGLELRHLTVVLDDFNLPFGRIRFRKAGSSGGHNGLESIVAELGSKAFPRLRIGIAGDTMPQEKALLAGYVLSEFTPTEHRSLAEIVAVSADAILLQVEHGVLAAAELYNSITVV